MSRAWIVVSPMNDASLRVPVILPTERHLVSLSQTNYSWCDIDVVGDEQCLTGAKFQDEPLMSTALVVVSENSLDHALAFHLKLAVSLFEGATKDSVAIRVGSALRVLWQRRAAEKASPE
jgi:hypothetical protein